MCVYWFYFWFLALYIAANYIVPAGLMILGAPTLAGSVPPDATDWTFKGLVPLFTGNAAEGADPILSTEILPGDVGLRFAMLRAFSGFSTIDEIVAGAYFWLALLLGIGIITSAGNLLSDLIEDHNLIEVKLYTIKDKPKVQALINSLQVRIFFYPVTIFVGSGLLIPFILSYGGFALASALQGDFGVMLDAGLIAVGLFILEVTFFKVVIRPGQAITSNLRKADEIKAIYREHAQELRERNLLKARAEKQKLGNQAKERLGEDAKTKQPRKAAQSVKPPESAPSGSDTNTTLKGIFSLLENYIERTEAERRKSDARWQEVQARWDKERSDRKEE